MMREEVMTKLAPLTAKIENGNKKKFVIKTLVTSVIGSLIGFAFLNARKKK